jgi:hypothetical protein
LASLSDPYLCSGEIHDFLEEDLKYWYPELASRMKITLVEALPSVLPMFSKALIEYTESTFKEAKIDILTKTMVKEIKEKSVTLQMPDKSIKEVPCGMVVWAAVRFTFPSLSSMRCELYLSIPGKHSPSSDKGLDGSIPLGANESPWFDR